jgi:hypothetical protein
MESGQHQHICPWNGDLRIYAIRGQLRNSGFFKHYNRCLCIANFSNRSKFILPECHSAGTPFNVEGRNYRNLESGQHQYVCPWNCDLYIYTDRGRLLDSGFFEHYNRWKCLTDFSNHSKFILPECDSAGTTTGVEGRSCRNMEPGQHQYVCPWNGDLYIYTDSGQLLASGFLKYCNRQQLHADI